MTFLAVSANQRLHRGAIHRIVIVLFIMFLVMEELAQPTMAGKIWSKLMNNTEEEGKSDKVQVEPPTQTQLKSNEFKVMKQAFEVNRCYHIYNASASTGLTPKKINQIKSKLKDAHTILRKLYHNEQLDEQIANTIPVTVKNLEKLLELTENPDNLTKPYEPIQPEKLKIDYEVMFKQDWFRHLNAEKFLNLMGIMMMVTLGWPLLGQLLGPHQKQISQLKQISTTNLPLKLPPTMFHSDIVTKSLRQLIPSNPIMSIILLIVVAVTISAIVYVITCLVTRKRDDSKKMSKSSRVDKSSSVKSGASSRSSVDNSSPKEKKSGNRSSPKSMK